MSFSVLMAVYNKEKPDNLCACFESIKNQQLLPDEVVLVEDGPINEELSLVIESYRNKLNIISPKLKNNSGLATALNLGMEYCSFDLIARMDTDDICMPNRFQLQYSLMMENEKISVCSGLVDEYDDSMLNYISTRTLPEYHDDIVIFSKSRSPISHPAAMFRKSIVEKVGKYPLLSRAQDYGLWSNIIMNGYELYNIQSVLVKMRCGDGLLERRGFNYLLSEIDLLKYQHKIGFLNTKQFMSNILSRIVLRLSPKSVKQFIYYKYR